jgi:putative ABC transport system ATP-binding protein
MSGNLLEIHGLVKDYQSLRPLRVRALEVQRGIVISLMGFDAGAAEVFVHLVTGAALPDEGDVRLFGTNTRDITDVEAWLQSLDGLGLVSHRAVLVEPLSVLQNVAMPVTLDVDPIPAEHRPVIEALAHEAGIEERLWDRPLGQVDPETSLRVRLARAIAPDPLLLLVEHPSATLPREAVSRVAADVGRVASARGAALLTLTADADWASAVGGEVRTLVPASGDLASDGGFVKRFRRMLGGR